ARCHSAAVAALQRGCLWRAAGWENGSNFPRNIADTDMSASTLRRSVTFLQPPHFLTHVRFLMAVGRATRHQTCRHRCSYLGVEPPFGPTHRERRRPCLFFSGILGSPHNPKFLWVDDAEIVGDRITEVRPVP